MSDRSRSKAVAQIVNSYVWKTGLQSNSLPGLLDSGEVGATACARKHELAGAAMLV